MKIKKSDFKRICPMAEMKPGEWGVSLETDCCLVQCLREDMVHKSTGSVINVISISSTREWDKKYYPKSNMIGILGGTLYPNHPTYVDSDDAKEDEIHIQVED